MIKHLNKHQNINFNIEQENVVSLWFLVVKISCKNGKFVTSVYRKPTFSGAFTNYENFILIYQKRGLLHTLLHRSFSICCGLRLSSEKKIILRISLIRVLNHFLINCVHLKLLFRMYLK